MIRFEAPPPAPADGTGDTVVQIGQKELALHWTNGEIVAIRDTSGETIPLVALQVPLNIPMAPLGTFGKEPKTMEEAVQCYKCWVDTDSGAWICLPTTC